MGQREDDMVMVTRQKPGLLEREPPLSLERRALRTRPVAARIVPDTRDMAVRAGLDMATEGRGPALHDGARGSADVGGQGMGAFIVGIASAEDILQGNEAHIPPRIVVTNDGVLP